MTEWTPIRWCIATLVAGLMLSGASRSPGQPEAQPTGEIEIGVDSFGVGATGRVGEWVGLRLGLTDSADRPRDVLVSVGLKDGDGDTPLFQRVVATNPGFRQPVWLYARLPFWFNSSAVLNVTVHAATELSNPPADPSLPQYGAGRLLGQSRIPAPQWLLPSQVGMYGVIGRRVMGLAPYEGDANFDSLRSGHERSEVVPIDLTSLPDRWMGLAQFEVIAWGEGQPGQLSNDAAHAIREWVRRGGHLVLIVPRVAQTWSDPATNPLHDITPDVRVERRENVDLATIEPLIRDWEQRGRRSLPERETMHVFAPRDEGAWGDGVHPILNTPDGECMVVRRLEGAGAVTMIGLDLTARFFADNLLPRPEYFWHRILGRRGAQLSSADFSQRPDGSFPTITEPARDNYTLDRDFGGQIDKKEQAAAGVLIGFVVFVAYWLVAGPVGFFLLKRSGRAHHAWVAFLAAAGLFTAVAWGGATAIRPSKVRGFHLTFLDHVYGQDWQRARSWINILIPTYGEAGVSIGDPASRETPALGGADRIHNAVAPWEAPGSGSSGGFPDARAYVIESKSPETMRFPARQTVKQFEMEWSGGPQWGMPAPQPTADGQPGVLTLGPSGDGQPVLHGVLKHNLPGPLRDITLVVVRGQKQMNRSLLNPLSQQTMVLSHVVIQARTSAWAPGDAWDLSTVTQDGPNAKNDDNTSDFLGKLIGSMRLSDDSGGQERLDTSGLADRLNALSLFTQLAPPDLDRQFRQSGQPLAIRRLSHGLDLGRWFTQPCVIVIGHLGTEGEEPSPVPVYVDTGGGYRAAATAGRTVVRWVYPLPAAPPAYPPTKTDDEGEGPA